MGRRGVRAILLGEDDEHLRFARYALLQLGFHKREVYPRPAPAGRGAGDQYVRGCYAAEVCEHRRRASAQRVVLLVLIDADKNTVRHRHEQLTGVLSEAHLPARGNDEAIVVWIPKRHVETWIAYLAGHHVDETKPFKKVAATLDLRASAQRFATLIRDSDQRRQDTPPSMTDAFEESRRLPPPS